MNWKYEAIDKLKMYEAKKKALVLLPVELKRLEQEAVAIRSAASDGNPVRGGGSGREDMLLNNIVAKQENRSNMQDAAKWVKIVDAALEVLTEEEKLVLDRFYINPARGAVDRLCEELACEKTTVYRKRDKALEHFTVVLYGRCWS